MGKKRLNLNFLPKNLKGVEVKRMNETDYDSIAKFIAERSRYEKSKNSIKLQLICEELYKNGFIERDITDINFFKEHIKKLELFAWIEAPILEAFENLEDVK